MTDNNQRRGWWINCTIGYETVHVGYFKDHAEMKAKEVKKDGKKEREKEKQGETQGLQIERVSQPGLEIRTHELDLITLSRSDEEKIY